MISRKVYFAEVWFGDKYYIGGVDILAENPNRTFVKKVRFHLDVKPRRCYDADLYKFVINKRSFKVAITPPINDVRYIAFLTLMSFNASAEANDRKSRGLNREILLQTAVKHLSSLDDGCVYSDDLRNRCVIEEKGGKYVVTQQIFMLNPDATFDYPDDENNPYQYIGRYENVCGPSYFDTKANAKRYAEQQMRTETDDN